MGWNDLLRDYPLVVYDLNTNWALQNILMAVRQEFNVRLQIKDGWGSVLGKKISLGVEVRSLNMQLEKLTDTVVSYVTLPFWEELAVWFAARYYKLAFKDGKRINVKKKALGNYPFLDLNDRIFWLFTDVKQLDLATVYFQISRMITQRVTMHVRGEDEMPFVLEPVQDEYLFNEYRRKYFGQQFVPLPRRKQRAMDIASALPLTEDDASEASELHSRSEIENDIPLVRIGIFPRPSAPPKTNSSISEASEVPSKYRHPAPSAPQLSQSSESGERRSEFECIVTGEMMKTAVICIRDGCTYEDDVIRKIIIKMHKTPTNIPVNADEIETVIRPNITLQNAMNCYLAQQFEADCYRCPITGKYMEDAMFCTLDNLSYEKDAIVELLTNQRQTPDGIELPDGVGADSVLVANLTLRKVIESHMRLEQKTTQSNTLRLF